MKHSDDLVLLIEKAAKIAGSYSELARLLGVKPQAVTNWRRGDKPCPFEDVALMASIAGVDPATELARALVRKNEGTPKGEKLMRALGKASLATGAVLVSVGAHASVICGTALDSLTVDTRIAMKRFAAALRARFTRSCNC